MSKPTASLDANEKRAFHSLLSIAETALRSDTFRPLDETLDHICRLVKEMLHCRSAMIRLLSESNQLVVAGYSEPGDEYVVNESQGLGDETLSQSLPDERNPSVEVFLSGRSRHVFASEFTADSHVRRSLEAGGVASIYFAPIVRESATIGVLECYWPDEHEVTSADVDAVAVVARLAAISLATVTIAANDAALRESLEMVHTQLQEDNAQLRNVGSAQSRMIGLLADQAALTVEQTTRLLSSTLKRSVLVVDAQGEELALEADPGHVEQLRTVARIHVPRGGLTASMPQDTGCSVMRIEGGPGGRSAGLIAVSPAVAADEDFNLIVLKQAALVIGAHVQARSANSAMINHAMPLALLAMSRGLLNNSQMKEMKGIFQLATDVELVVVLVSTPTPEAAFRLSRRQNVFAAVGWPVVTAVADGADVLVLLRDSLPTRTSTAALIDRVHEVVCVGVSTLVPGLGELRVALIEARASANVAAGNGSTIFYDDFGSFPDVASGMTLGQIRDYVEKTIGTIVEYDARRGSALVRTLRVFIMSDGQAADTAAGLQIHVNTVHQRLARIEELTGINLRSYRDLTRVMLALDLLPIASGDVKIPFA